MNLDCVGWADASRAQFPQPALGVSSQVSFHLLRVDVSQLEHVIITPSTPGSVSGESLVGVDSLTGSGVSGH